MLAKLFPNSLNPFFGYKGGRQVFVLVIYIILCFGSGLWGTTATTVTHDSGNISTTLYNLPTTTSRALEPGQLTICVPHGERVTSVDLHYTMTAVSPCTTSEQRSFLLCTTSNISESQIYSGSGTDSGAYEYTRTGLNIANNLIGEITFELHAFRSSGGTGSGTEHSFVNDGSWSLTVYSEETPPGTTMIDLFSYNIGMNSVSLGWVDHSYPQPQSWDLIWGEAGFDPASQGTLITGISINDYSLTGLQPSTTYTYYLRSVFADGVIGLWSSPLSFTTLMANGEYYLYNIGDISTTLETDPSTSSRAMEYGSVLLEIPDGKKINSVDISYSMIARSGSSIADQRSFLCCLTNNTTEDLVYAGEAPIPEGRCNYSRNGLTLANGLTGLVEFQIHAFRTSGGSGSNTDYNFIENNTFCLTVHYAQLNPPTDLLVSQILNNSAVLDWTENCDPPAYSWDVIYNAGSFDPSVTGTLISGLPDCHYILAGLSSFTTYNVYIRSDRGTVGLSDWAGPIVFTTPPDNGYSLVYNQGQIPTTLVADPSLSDRAETPGLLSVTIPSDKKIVSVELQYYMTTGNGSFMSDQRSFLLCSTNGVTESQVYNGTGNSSGTCAYSRSGLTLANGLFGNVDFELHAFRITGGSGTNEDYNYVENGSWRLIISCEDRLLLETPSELATVNIGYYSADLCWTENCYPLATSWDIKYGANGFDPNICGTLISGVSSNPYSLSGLTDSYYYSWYVRSNKDSLGCSEWAGPISFITLSENGALLVYTAGDIPSTYLHNPTTNDRALEPGLLSLTVPEGKRIVSVDIEYSLTGRGVYGRINFQRSFLLCSTNNITEPQVYSVQNYGSGTQPYSRTGLTLANDLIGTVSFELHVFMISGGVTGTSDCTYNFVNNNTWRLVVHYGDALTVTQPYLLNTTNISMENAELSWIDNCYPPATRWDIIYGGVGFDPVTEGTLISNITSNPYILNGLVGYSSYSWYVRSVTNAYGASDWSGPCSFMTPLEIGPTLTYSMGEIMAPYVIDPTTSSRSDHPGILSFVVPENRSILKMGVQYSVLAGTQCYQSNLFHFMVCSTNGVTEPQLYSLDEDTSAITNFSRSDVTIANGLTGLVTLELHVFKDTAYSLGFVRNSTWKVTVYYVANPVVLSAPSVSISTSAGSPVISWTGVANASSYKIYTSDMPGSSASWSLLTIIPATTLSYTCSTADSTKFFRVVASSDLPADIRRLSPYLKEY